VKSYVGRVAVTAALCISVPSAAYASTVKVGSGETLWGIAMQHHVSVSSLEQVNGLHTTTLHVGQVLQIPGTSSTSSHASSSYVQKSAASTERIAIVTVQKGDTIYGISSRYGTTTAATLRLNGLTASSVLHIGQKLKVYAGGVGSHSSRGESSPSGLGSDVQGMNISNFAKQFLGVPYRWGGESAYGFDCSGLVQFVYGHFGIHLGRSSYSQYSEGSWVNSRYPNIGDLVFFNTDGPGASHVGIYVGNGEFINAEDRGVRIDSLSSGYWGAHYIGARHF
jgi:peptidoglycan DL-endopeptidase LytE